MLTVRYLSTPTPQAMKGDKDARIKPFLISHGTREGITKWRPHEHIYAPYNKSENNVMSDYSTSDILSVSTGD